MPDDPRERRFFTWPMAIGFIIIATAGILLLVGYLTFRTPVANAVMADASGKVVGSFRHVRGGIYFRAGWPFIIQRGVLSHGTGGACLIAGVSDRVSGLPATCNEAADCVSKLPPAMAGWGLYCSPEKTCWARPKTPFDQGIPRTPQDKLSCNRSPEPLDPSWPSGTTFMLNTDYPSNDTMDSAVSRRWRVVACINRADPDKPNEDVPGCSGEAKFGKVLTLP